MRLFTSLFALCLIASLTAPNTRADDDPPKKDPAAEKKDDKDKKDEKKDEPKVEVKTETKFVQISPFGNVNAYKFTADGKTFYGELGTQASLRTANDKQAKNDGRVYAKVVTVSTTITTIEGKDKAGKDVKKVVKEKQVTITLQGYATGRSGILIMDVPVKFIESSYIPKGENETQTGETAAKGEEGKSGYQVECLPPPHAKEGTIIVEIKFPTMVLKNSGSRSQQWEVKDEEKEDKKDK